MTHGNSILQKYLDLNDGLFLASDINFVNSRVLSSWIVKGIIKPINGGGRRRKLSFLELCWLKIVTELRDYEISFEIILKIKEQLFTELDLSQLNFSKHHDDTFKERAKHSPFTEKSLRDISERLQPIFDQQQLLNRKSNYLEYVILNAIVINTPTSIIVTPTGERIFTMEHYIQDFFSNEVFMNIFRHSHFTISITDVINFFIHQSNFELPYKRLVVTNKEEEILNLLRTEKIKSATIKFDGTYSPELIIIEQSIKVDAASRVSDLIARGAYQDISITTQQGAIIHCSKKTKFKLN